MGLLESRKQETLVVRFQRKNGGALIDIHFMTGMMPERWEI